MFRVQYSAADSAAIMYTLYRWLTVLSCFLFCFVFFLFTPLFRERYNGMVRIKNTGGESKKSIRRTCVRRRTPPSSVHQCVYALCVYIVCTHCVYTLYTLA